MSLKIGIVGLPNVGKSTIFNALVGAKSAQAANYPFCTIDPNVGVVEVPDERLKKLTEINNPDSIIPTVIEFVDIAGLVKGASKGEGLGNQFLANIRECDAIAQVVRFFKDSNIIHVHGEIDPKRDREIIDTELILADLQTVEKRLHKARTEARSPDKEKKEYLAIIEKLYEHLAEGDLAINLNLEHEEKLMIRDLHLLTIKPNLHIVNLHEDQIKDFDKSKYAEILDIKNQEKIIPICARAAYHTLNLITFLTAGPKEVRAWTVEKGALAPEAAGVIHTDFQKGFIKAEVIKYEDYKNAGSENAAKEQGKMKMEGKEYEVQDGDIMHFKFAN